MPGCCITLMAINILLYFYTASTATSADPDHLLFMLRWGLTDEVATGDWWRLITSGFLHFDFMHLTMNMFFLYQAGRMTEKVLGLRRFLWLYGLSLIGSSLLSFGWHAYLAQPYVSAGASGALMGIYFGFTGYILAIRKNMDPKIVKGVLRATLITAGLNAAIGIMAGFDNAGHLGGGLTGFALGYGFGVRPPFHFGAPVKRRWLAAALVLAAFVGLDLSQLSQARANVAQYATDRAAEAQLKVTQDFVVNAYAPVEQASQKVRECFSTEFPLEEDHRRYESLRDAWAAYQQLPAFLQLLQTDPNMGEFAKAAQRSVLEYRQTICRTQFYRISVQAKHQAEAAAPDTETIKIPGYWRPLFEKMQKTEAWPEFQAELKADETFRKDWFKLRDWLEEASSE